MGNIQYSVGNGVPKELIRMTHGHEQWWRNCLWDWGMVGGGGQKGKNHDNGNSITKNI